MFLIVISEKPFIAHISGSAFGDALGLIACCYIAIACDTAEFSFSEVRLDLAPAVISPYILMTMGCHETSLADTFGISTPLHAQCILAAVAARFPVDQIAAHFHDTRYQALDNILISLEMGVSIIGAPVAAVYFLNGMNFNSMALITGGASGLGQYSVAA